MASAFATAVDSISKGINQLRLQTIVVVVTCDEVLSASVYSKVVRNHVVFSSLHISHVSGLGTTLQLIRWSAAKIGSQSRAYASLINGPSTP